MEFLYSLGAAFLVSLVSFFGIALFIKKLNSKRLFMSALVSFAAGALLGDAFIHLIGEHIEVNGYSIDMIVAIFIGILFMLIIEAYFHCSHDSEEELTHNVAMAKNNLVGDSIHNFLDGIAIASSFIVSPVVGISSTIAIVIHEIPQEFADAGILLYSGWSRKKVFISNFITALTAILGVVLVFVLQSAIEGIENFLIPLAAGQFIYIALADLVPEIHRRKGVLKYVIEISTFVLGFVAMYALVFLE